MAFPQAGPTDPPALQALPHYQSPLASYDGQFYAQRALDPLLRDPTIDRGMDLAPFRARRILFSWTAYVLGLGRPAWILEAYALQNVVCWLILAALVTRWLNPVSARGLALWYAVLFSHGLLWSVSLALLDGPSLVLIMCAVIAVEAESSAAFGGHRRYGDPRPRNQPVVVPGAADSARTLAAGPAWLSPRSWRCCRCSIWMDYLRSIYRSTTLAGTDSFVLLGTGLAASWGDALSMLTKRFPAAGSCRPASSSRWPRRPSFIFVRRDYAAPWWRVACAYAVMLLFLDPVLANPQTGAITRVMLPLTVGFNILLATEVRPRRFWTWFVVGNLHLLPAYYVMPLAPW